MTTGQIDETLEQQIAAIVQRTLDDHYQDLMTFGPIRFQTEADSFGKPVLNIYIVFDGDEDLLYPRWDSGALLPEHILPCLSPFGITQRANYWFVHYQDWKWLHKAKGLDS